MEISFPKEVRVTILADHLTLTTLSKAAATENGKKTYTIANNNVMIWKEYCYRNRERLRCNGILIISKPKVLYIVILY